jgi:hypothetical protein
MPDPPPKAPVGTQPSLSEYQTYQIPNGFLDKEKLGARFFIETENQRRQLSSVPSI